MDILNLVDKDESTVKYKIIKFPDGQQNVEVQTIPSEKIKIVSRLNNFMDLELIICATQCLKESYVKEIHLYIPYCIGGRSDRRFNAGGINYIKNVIAPILNSQGYASVSILDAHSDVLEACINRFYNVDLTYSVIIPVLTNYVNEKNSNPDRLKDCNINDFLIVSPDAGSLKKIYNIAKDISYTNEIIVATKHRDVETGEIRSTNVQISVHDANKDIFIIDDICDGGRTFIELAKAIKFSRDLSSAVHPSNHGKLYLVVTHGIFSNGLDELKQYFNKIYTTNSVKDIKDESVFQIKLF